MDDFDFNVYIHKVYDYTVEPANFNIINGPTILTDVFRFAVTPSFEDNSLLQVVTVAGSNIIYTREYIAGVFGAWQTGSGGSSDLPPQDLNHLYVSQASNALDTNPGTVVQPLLTVQSGINQITPTGIVTINGDFEEDVIINKPLALQGYANSYCNYGTKIRSLTVGPSPVGFVVLQNIGFPVPAPAYPIVTLSVGTQSRVMFIDSFFFGNGVDPAIEIQPTIGLGQFVIITFDSCEFQSAIINLADLTIGAFGICRFKNKSFSGPTVNAGIGWTVEYNYTP